MKIEIEHPVRVAIEDYRLQVNTSERLDKLLLAFELLMRFDALLLAAVFLETEEYRDDKVRGLLMSNKFTLGEWYDLLRTLVSVVQGGPLSDVRNWFIRTEKRSVFQGILRIRRERAHDESRTTSEFVVSALRDGEHLFEQCLADHPDLGRFREGTRGRLLLERTSVTATGGLFLLSGLLAKHPGTVLMYRGCKANRFSYGSLSGVQYWSSETYREVIDLLRKKISPLEFIEATDSPDILHGRMVDSTRLTLRRLTELKRYRPETTIDRIEADSVRRAFVEGDRPLVLVEGPAGAGKTTWLCRTAEERLGYAATVFFDTADHLPQMIFPDALGPILRVRGEISTALDRLAITSTDGRVLIALDEIGATGREEEVLLSLFHWVERLPSTSAVRIIATIRSSQFQAFLAKHADALPGNLVQLFQLSPLSSNELIALAEKLPVPQGSNHEIVLSSRRAVAIRMGEIASASARRPALAVVILESAGLGSVPLGFSASFVYRELFSREIVEATFGSVPKRPGRARIVRRVAEILLKRASTRVAMDDYDLAKVHLINMDTGERSLDYEALLSAQILVETVEDYVSFVSFVDPRFFEFAAALNFPIAGLSATLSELWHRSTAFPPALSVAAHLVIRAVGSSGIASTCSAIEELSQWRERLLFEVALLDGTSFLPLFSHLASLSLLEAQSLVEALLRAEEPRLGAHAAQLLIDCISDRPDRVMEARFLLAQALYDVDDYDGTENELERMGDERSPRIFVIRAEIAVARGDFEQARDAYEALLQTSPHNRSEEVGHALRGLGYVLGRTGHPDEAEKRLREAINVLETQRDSQILAEAWGDLGELLGKSGRLSEAQDCLERSMSINRRTGLLVGIGVVEGLIGEIDVLEGRLDSAAEHLSRALDICRRLGNRWREAWVLERLARLNQMCGRTSVADVLLEEAHRLYKAIGSQKQ